MQKKHTYAYWNARQLAYLEFLAQRDLVSVSECLRRIVDAEINRSGWEWQEKTKPDGE
jgi:hypothetical protein